MKRIEKKLRLSRKNILLLTVVTFTAVVAAVLASAEPNTAAKSSAVLLDQSDSDDILIGNSEQLEDTAAFDDTSLQSMNFRKDMSIRDALRFLAAKYRKNIIPSANVNGKLNITSLYEVTFKQALDAILGPGYHYEIEGSFIRVYTTEEYARYSQDVTRMASRVYILNYINAAEAVTLITPILSSEGKIASTTAAEVDTEAGEGGDTHAMKDTIVVFDLPNRLEKVADTIRQIDIQPQQILIEVTILEATLTEGLEFGIDWSRIGGITSASTPFGMSASLTNASAQAFTATVNHSQIGVEIKAQEDITDTTILANPKIMALNKQAGYVNIGEERGYTASTTQSETTTTSVEFLISGTILRFRPYICKDDYIRMEINPELSSGELLDANDNLPLKTITTVKTNIMVKDNHTIIIGGLFKENLTSADTQIPVIGDLPIIGNLFKSTSDSNVRKELVILITPHLIRTPEELTAQAEEKMRDIDRIRHGSRDRMNPMARARLYEDSYAKAVDFYIDKEYDKSLAELNWIIAYRPNALEAVRLKEKILAETDPAKLNAQERVVLDKTDAEHDKMWIRK